LGYEIIGDIMLALALLLYASDMLCLLSNRSRDDCYLLTAAGTLTVSASLLSTYYFMTDNFVLSSVYAHSSRSLPQLLKLSASWTGAGGSLLLWLTMMTITTLAFRIVKRRTEYNERVSSIVMSFFTIVVLGFTLIADPFRQLGIPVPDGTGQSPSLRNFWSMLHPPLVFAAYTAILLSYAIILGRRWALKSEPNLVDDRVLWLSWVLLSLAISLGGVWAYETTGWGGYWAWDPIETAALVPWLSLTALLLSKRFGAAGDYDLFSITFSASAVFFTVYVARAAAAPSVHGYGSFIGGVFILIISVLPILLSLMTVKKAPLPHNRSENIGVLAEAAFWSMIFIGWANLLLLFYESFASLFGAIAYLNPALHNYVTFPFLIVFLAAAITKLINPARAGVAVFYLATILVVSVAIALLGIPTGNLLADLGMPFVLALLAASAYGLVKYVLRLRPTRRHAAFRRLIFFGLALLLIGVFVSASMQSSVTVTVTPGETIRTSGLKLIVVDITTSPSDRQAFVPRYGMRADSIDTKIIYTMSDAPSDSKVLVLRYYPAFDRYLPEPSIFRSLTSDTYLSVGVTDAVRKATLSAFANGTETRPTNVRIAVRTIPGISFMWLGVALAIIGGLPFAFVKSPMQATRENPEL
jgi:cytochrome c-type biogenesis protein CcmF